MLEQLEQRGDLNFSFSGLKTAVVTLTRARALDAQARADVAAAFQEAVVDVLVAKSRAAIGRTGLSRLVVAGGVGANLRLRVLLDAAASSNKFSVFYPAMEFCTDNGAMIALAGYLRLKAAKTGRALPLEFTVSPRWNLASVAPA
jgi:N6-L-threonylcarbamoyladenine synthase